ncbi:Osmotically-inducible protein OsmY, contains BON domain [Polaribacter sp. Hel1_33_78]|jgi:osmotically-inducible protein OsmY|uniref:BON domain-containing protein n=1 Tax=Polaribacter sp. Hel1_33_78 TaxID=1336804 RepID=UPI00087D3B19|nr:BON domain-containing protein [Polaribacter sp. Hel1_33_78]SDU19648.1 Osmotically-inducible protein OsmY, contains BON domain [Polaribacter sp. Hel1_33_78]
MKTDAEIKDDVLDELAWQPNIDETQIGVIVEDGVVTLSGVVNNYSKKLAAEEAVKSVEGVKAVAEDIEVIYGINYKKTDKEIAKAVVSAFEWNSSVPEDDIAIKVQNGWVYLSGEVQWMFQKNAARNAIKNLLGVKGVSNSIKLENNIEPVEVKNRIKKAFHRMATIDSNAIILETHGHTVTLRGKVHSIKEKEEAETAAYNAPGVYNVKNELQIHYSIEYA